MPRISWCCVPADRISIARAHVSYKSVIKYISFISYDILFFFFVYGVRRNLQLGSIDCVPVCLVDVCLRITDKKNEIIYYWIMFGQIITNHIHSCIHINMTEPTSRINWRFSCIWSVLISHTHTHTSSWYHTRTNCTKTFVLRK